MADVEGEAGKAEAVIGMSDDMMSSSCQSGGDRINGRLMARMGEHHLETE